MRSSKHTARRIALSLAVIILVGSITGALANPDARKFLTLWTGAPPTSAYSLGASTDQPPLMRLTVAGDVGTGDAEEFETAFAMTRLLNEGPIDALVLLGDNVYPNGDPAMLQQTVFVPFGSLLYSGTELLPVLGNHDIRDGNAIGQMKAFGMPNRWYSRVFDDIHFIGLDSSIATDPQQLSWLEAELAGSTSKWKIVAMHHPPYSAGWHGSHEPSQEWLVPIFEKYGVQLVLAGHDHDYQRSNEINGVRYVVSGGGSKIRRTSSEDFTAVSWSIHHFVELEVFEDRIFGQAYAQDGRVFDDFEISNSR
jgi:predicted phosphodiesterase